KEPALAQHQTGRNSGVIHSGIYYKPGSYKAQFARSGSRSMVEFCQKHGIAHEICGKLIVATEPRELPLLENLYQRGLANQLSITRLSAEAIKEIEPHVNGLAGIRVPSTGIVDYKQVAATYARLIQEQGGELCLGTKVEQLDVRSDGITIMSNRGELRARFLINCAGLHSDRVARLGKAQIDMQIVPFRGEYYELKPEKRYLVKHLIYPVPNPNFPFLGVHFTRMINGDVHAGPNAVLSLKREGYHKTDIDLRDSAEVLSSPAFWKLARTNMNEGIKEMIRSVSKAAFLRSLQRLIPEVQSDDIVPSHAGVRAQALRNDGALVDDFMFVSGPNALHVCNAPSPGATASIEIGKAIVERILSSN
ncbi:MAG TPA: L-2-hydroxyglutarate oxidase, partial [Roseiflexaceae bacterium]|nr:L-2-hydroxyglutarate oxidase [Roseiflexaceae bacterium]